VLTVEDSSKYPDLLLASLKSYMERGVNVLILDVNLVRRNKGQRNIKLGDACNKRDNFLVVAQLAGAKHCVLFPNVDTCVVQVSAEGLYLC
jgi:hypothetical protein